VVVGLSDMATVQRYPEALDAVDKVEVYPTYFPGKHDRDDLALARRRRPFTFSAHVRPICLPPGRRFPDRSGRVYVAGRRQEERDERPKDIIHSFSKA